MNKNRTSLKQLKNLCPSLDDITIRDHLIRLDDYYFTVFSIKQVARHLNLLADLSNRNPIKIIFNRISPQQVECSLLAYDYPYLFSLITGVLSAMGFRIITGNIFTYKHRPRVSGSKTKKGQKNSYARRSERTVENRLSTMRMIIDHFSGYIETPLSDEAWLDELENKLLKIFIPIKKGEENALDLAKHKVNQMVAAVLAALDIDTSQLLAPINIQMDNKSSDFTRMRIVSDDTPFFLYTLSAALSLNRISIEQVKIRTVKKRIEDEFLLLDFRGQKITSSNLLNQIKLSVLLTKQFTYFLGNASDPYTALCRFETIVQDLLKYPSKGRWFDLLSNPDILKELSRLLGISDFLWEDFIRGQYETLLPMLSPQLQHKRFSQPVETIARRLNAELKKAKTQEQKITALNDFKDREIYLIDLDHILKPEADFKDLSQYLTVLAENVVSSAFNIVYIEMVKEYGVPQTIAGIEARYAIMGLGKMGGAALGYASDIELLFIYSDNGKTSGSKSLSNTEFFEKLICRSVQMIKTKREGIFRIDLRLRPHGKAGPLACSLENFCRYYGRGGQAHSFERLSLVRLRKIGGNEELGAMVERLRDEMIYESSTIVPKDILSLRKRQYREKVKKGQLNAKFSPGALVDLEYAVQMLQVENGGKIKSLRTPKIHDALLLMVEAGILEQKQSQRLVAAYHFLRRLINGLRMLRGSADDLFIPEQDSDELVHLARRMGYEYNKDISPARQLYYDFQAYTAEIRVFIERYFGRDSLPGRLTGNAADLVLADNVTEDLQKSILTKIGFKNIKRAYLNLRNMAGGGEQREVFSRLAILALDLISRKPEPDMVLNNWERFVTALPHAQAHYTMFLSQPTRLDILLSIFSVSHFLAHTLVKNPEYLEWVTEIENLHQKKGLEDVIREITEICGKLKHEGEWLNAIRKYRRRELLRIGTKDICLKKPLIEITDELSTLAQGILNESFQRRIKEYKAAGRDIQRAFCIVAFGKLGGHELNYSSDIDLLGIYDDKIIDTIDKGRQILENLLERIQSDLSEHTEEGYAYRVDFRLRPYGESGLFIQSLKGMLKYYQTAAHLWEIQALIKMRPVAGNLELGKQLRKKLQQILLKKINKSMIIASIKEMRSRIVKKQAQKLFKGIDLKKGYGGIRDIEFLVQGLQYINLAQNPDLFEQNTLRAIGLLKESNILKKELANNLQEDYIFLRRIEHYLQILEDQQTSFVSDDLLEMDILAKRIYGINSSAEDFLDNLNSCISRVQQAFNDFIKN